jgi:hypothetical protein
MSVICTRDGRAAKSLPTSAPNRWVTAGMEIYAGGKSIVVDVVKAALLQRDRCR